MQLKSVKHVKSYRNKKVLLRLDLDVPVGRDNKVHTDDDMRLEVSLPTIKYLLKRGAEVIIVGHRGRPDGQRVSELSIKPIAKRLSELLGSTQRLSEERVGGFDAFSFLVGKKWISVLENVRYFPGETRNNIRLAKDLAGLADIYVNDAFANSHREHASMSSIMTQLPSFAGLNLVKEVSNIGKVVKRPKRPLTLIIGGVKGKTKLALIEKFIPRADYILIGSAFAANFYEAMGTEVGTSVLDPEIEQTVRKILNKPRYRILDESRNTGILLDPESVKNISPQLLKDLKKRIILPVDLMLGSFGSRKQPIHTLVKPRDYSFIPKNLAALDIGPLTIRLYSEIIKKSGTIVWNGPMGLFEQPPYDKGTHELAKAVAVTKSKSIVGGGDTVAAIESEHVTLTHNTFVSTGGGAMLEFLINQRLPGIKPLIMK